jgi:hypothetical protein
VILSCNYEEVQALQTGTELLLSYGEGGNTSGAVAAPAEALAQVALLQPRLTGSLSIGTLAEQRWIRKAVGAICSSLHERMEAAVVEYHPAHEEAVNLYFDYAHAYGVLRRLDELGAEMAALIELMTGGAPTEATAAAVSFAD